MQYDLILSNIGKYISLSTAEITLFTSKLRLKEVKKKDCILQQGKRCKNIYFLNQGTLRAFHLSQTGKETTVMFAIPDWWITDISAFTNQVSAVMHIVAVENSQLWVLSHNDFESLCVQLPKFERFFRILMQRAYVREQLRTIQNLSLPAAERYAAFILKYPDIVEKVPQKQIASYLGITPEFLSTIKTK